MVGATDVEAALGTAVSKDEQSPSRERCRYVSEGGAEVEITLDRPGFTGAVAAYRRLNPDAERVEAVGDEAALRLANGSGELVFVQGSVRFFVVINGGSRTREALLSVARTASRRL